MNERCAVKRKQILFALALSFCLALALAMPSMAAAAKTIKPGVTVTLATNSGLKKVKVGGLTTAKAREKLRAYTLRKTPDYVYLIERGSTYKIKTGDLALKPNVAELARQASVAETNTAVGGTYVTEVAKKKISSRLTKLAAKLNVKSSSHAVAGGGTVKNLGGHTLDEKAALKALVAALNKYGASKATKPSVLSAPMKRSKPKMTGRSTKGKVLVASLSQRVVYLFNANKLVVQYGICIGMPGYPTPTGTQVVTKKRLNPTWVNPGAALSRGMSQTITGANGPLGKAALYLKKNGRDIGIRFHGTSKLYSIGHAQSHGCMRLANSDIVKLYAQVPVGTMVSVFK